MIKRRAFLRAFLQIVVPLLVAGCGIPAPPQAVNALLPDNAPIYSVGLKASERADVEMVVRCRSVKEYAKTIKGDWERHWYQVVFEVIEVTAGRWDDPNVVFVFYDSWPTPESGMILKKPMFPYRTGWVFALWLDTSQKPALIVGHERRSVIPPHAEIRRPAWNSEERETRELLKNLIEAARTFIERQGKKLGGFQVAEEHDDFFVVEIHSAFDWLAVIVKKETWEVSSIEPPPRE
jgi:hypothetical protein